jgi:ABC-2 type transport system permease protein
MSKLTGTLLLVRSHLRSGWRGLVFWVVAMSGLVVATGWSITELYPTLAERQAYAASVGASPAIAAFNGRNYDLTSLGGIVSYEVGFMALIGVPIVAIHLAIRFSRYEEDSGRTELVTAGRIGRLGPLAAAGVTVGIALASFAVLSAIGLQATGLPVGSSWLYTAGLGLFGAAFAGIGLLAAEVSRESRMAYFIGLVVVLVTFLVRALIDGRGWDATWASPSGWVAEVRPWGDARWWPLMAYAALALACGLLAAAMATHRDLYGGLLATRPGPAYASPALGTPAGLAWRFTRAPLIGWLLGLALWSAAFGLLADEVTEAVAANPSLLEAIGIENPAYVVTSLALLLSGVGASAFGVQATVRLAHEEIAGRLGLVLSTRASRGRVWFTRVAVVVVEAVFVLLASTLVLSVTTAWATGDTATIASTLRAGAVLSLPVVLIVSVSAALHAFVPRGTAVAWVLVGWATVVGLLAETLRLPEWSRDLSPLNAVGNVPIEAPDIAALVVVTVLSGLFVVSGFARFRRRDLLAG